MAHFPIHLYDVQQLTLPAKPCFKMKNKDGWDIYDEPEKALAQLDNPKATVVIKATNSGVLINNRVYPGPRMSDSLGSWTANYGRPILSDHPAVGPFAQGPDPDVLGRIGKATYSRLIDKRSWMTDYKKPLPTGTDGSGYITTHGVISGRTNVEAVMDQRLFTVSVGQRPDQYFCSICAQDWCAAGPCGHDFGKTYELDEKNRKGTYLAFGITGNLNYDHLAFVNTPADVRAQVLSATMQADSQHPAFDISVRPVAQTNLVFALVDRQGRTLTMIMDNSDDTTFTSEVVSEEPVVQAAVDLFEILGTKEDSMPDTPEELVTSTATPPPTTEEPPAQQDSDQTSDDDVPADDTQQDSNSNWTQPDPDDGHTHRLIELDENGNGMVEKVKGHDHTVQSGRVLPTNMEGSMSRHPGTWFYDKETKAWVMQLEDAADDTTDTPEDIQADDSGAVVWSDSELEGWALSELEDHEEEQELYRKGVIDDAPLTAAQRKSLKPSDFCGPNRSFPVNDAARVTNALTRLSQGYPKNADATIRAKVKAVVLRQAKALGVTVEDTELPQADTSTRDTVIDTLGQEIQKKQTELTNLEGALAEREAELMAAREQNDTLSKQIRNQMIDRIVDMEVTLKKPGAREAQTPEALQVLRDKLGERTLESLTDRARDLQSELAGGSPSGSTFSPSDEPVDNPSLPLGAAPMGDQEEKVDYKNRALRSLKSDQN